MNSLWIQTYTGKKFYPLNPRPEDIDIKDIAYVLSGEWRFGGHCRPRISVGQHSVLVRRKLESLGCFAETQLWGLLHDGEEAFTRDLNRPIKHAKGMEVYREIGTAIQRAIAERFDLPWPIPDIVHEVDNRLMVTEAQYNMAPLQPGFFDKNPYEPFDDVIFNPWGVKKTYKKFLHDFAELQLLHQVQC